MNRRTSPGGRRTPGPKSPKGERAKRQRARAADPDAVGIGEVDWSATPEEFELDPALVERIRARSRLRSITLRVGREQIAAAREVAARTGRKYQAVLRQWLAEGASRARTRPPPSAA